VLESAGALDLMRARPLLALAGVLEGLPPRRLTGPVSERLRLRALAVLYSRWEELLLAKGIRGAG